VILPEQHQVEFADYGEILRRRWWLIMLGVLVGVGASLFALQILPKTYTSTALVQVKSVGEDGSVANGRTSGSVNLDTEAQLVTSSRVATLARDSLHSVLSARELVKQVSVTVPPNTSVLSISFADGSPQAAQAGAQAFAESYLVNRKAVAEADLASRAEAIRDQIRNLRAQLMASNKRLASTSPKSAEHADARATSESLTSQIKDLNDQLTPLLGQGVNPGSVITEAQVPLHASSPNKQILMASGLLAGLLAGSLLAFAVDRTDRRVRGRRDLERLGLDVLTNVVTVPAIRDAGTSPAVGEGAESLRQLRNALLAQMGQRAGSVLVANASDAAGGSAVSVSLAVTIARSGANVVLVSANTVRCAVEQAFDVPVQPGLVDVLRARSDVEAAIFHVPYVPNLRAVPAGADGALSSDLLQGARFGAVISELMSTADVVVVDVAPPSVNADAQTLVTSTDGALLVATALKTKRDEVLGAVDQFRHVSARVFGSVVVYVNRERRTNATGPRQTDPDPRGRRRAASPGAETKHDSLAVEAVSTIH
jgi:capsular exopolysaccharide synthesis family protein